MNSGEPLDLGDEPGTLATGYRCGLFIFITYDCKKLFFVKSSLLKARIDFTIITPVVRFLSPGIPPNGAVIREHQTLELRLGTKLPGQF